ncbi:aminotransferase class V-fold PLP-dependent enzyme [Kibdelosporangium persicum]|uniref:Aromatic-L-amino-acid decarboxylase n=1 Tax=Kibdelosporangium persicum TaxID=2698649 RepID=A0ABX2F7V2_9PSEU|nr:aminotransferase class V-fold PLP-dependent enzyme [Kibdelosporangium persicum]NRN67040.1 Aromatic-L-amino-acid decarboxylase [Kibdelosporangium persicum]
MSGNTQPKAVIVGAGPVACLVAIELRRRAFQVELYERGTDFRRLRGGKGHSFNLTLTRRGLKSLQPHLIDVLHQNGVPLPQRVIHHADGSLSYQRYGTEEDHYLLSIPRGLLHHTLMDEAEKAGAEIFFEHECIRADPAAATATFATSSYGIREATGDILIGCDGANSIVRQEMSRRGARMSISQEYITDGFAELKMPPSAGGGFALLEALSDPHRPDSENHGLHVWPRGDFVLLSQPNVDRSYTTGLFMPLTSADPEQPTWDKLKTEQDVEALFSRYFPDIVPFLPQLTKDILAAPPSWLKTIKCFPYHHERTVLIGDSAHTMVPFYGQGINCSFEDVRTFFEILDRRLATEELRAGIRAALADFTEARKAPGDAIADLSLAMRAELKSHTDDTKFHARNKLEKQLHLRHPGDFVPLYHMVAFTNIPYNEVIKRHHEQKAILDELCDRFDIHTEAPKILDSFPASRDGVRTGQSLSFDLAPEQQRYLLDTVVNRLLRYQEDLANGKYPASYLHHPDGAHDPDGALIGAELREDDVPQHGTNLEVLLTEIFDKAVPNGMIHPHPGFMAHVPSGGLFQAAVGEFISRTLNRFPGAWAASPGFTQIESNVIRWFCAMLGYGTGSFGYLTTGGSIANFMALRCALARAGDVAQQRGTVYVSSQGHFSVAKAARMAGIPGDRVRSIGVNRDYTMDLDELRRAVNRDLDRGYIPTCVVGTAGTTSTGAVDDLAQLADFCAYYGIWLHADACFGGFFRLTARGKVLLAGSELADSIAVDAHKSLFLPHGISGLLVKDQSQLKVAFEIGGAAYVPELSTDDAYVDFCNYGPELTREARGLTAWLPIKLHGIKAFERCLDEKLDLADDLADRLRHFNDITLVERGKPHLPTVGFGVRSDNLADQARRNERLAELINSRGNVYLSTTTLPEEGVVVRSCILHHQTDKIVIDQLLEDVQWSLDKL